MYLDSVFHKWNDEFKNFLKNELLRSWFHKNDSQRQLYNWEPMKCGRYNWSRNPLASVISFPRSGLGAHRGVNGLCRKRYQEAVAVLRQQLRLVFALEYLEKPGLTALIRKALLFGERKSYRPADVGE